MMNIQMLKKLHQYNSNFFVYGCHSKACATVGKLAGSAGERYL